MKRVLSTLLTLALGAALACGAFFLYQRNQLESMPQSEEKTEIDLTVLEEALEENSELSTAKYLYTASFSVTDQNILDISEDQSIVLPFTQSYYIYEFDGVIKAGYDLSDVRPVQEGEDTVVVTLPAAKILSHDDDNLRVTYENQSVANPLHAGEESDWVDEQKAKMQERAESLGLYDEARENAKTVFESLYGGLLPEGVTLDIRFENEG